MGKLRNAVWNRDKGVCCDCGLDTEAEIRKHQDWYREQTGDELPRHKAITDLCWEWEWSVNLKSLWECDHDFAKALGGEDTVDNSVTRCWACHKKKTGENDMPKIAKGRRIRKKLAEHEKKMRAKFPGAYEG